MALLNPGEFVTCENNHVVAEVVKPLDIGERKWGDCVGNWRIERHPNVGDRRIPACPCGGRFCLVAGWYAGFHIEGRGWVPPKPEWLE